MDMKSRLSLLWIFYMFNAAYIDITTLYYSVFINHKAEVHYTQAFLFGRRCADRDLDCDDRPLSRPQVSGEPQSEHGCRGVSCGCPTRHALCRNPDLGLRLPLDRVDRDLGGHRVVCLEMV